MLEEADVSVFVSRGGKRNPSILVDLSFTWNRTSRVP